MSKESQESNIITMAIRVTRRKSYVNRAEILPVDTSLGPRSSYLLTDVERGRVWC